MLEAGVPFWMTLAVVGLLGSLTGAVAVFVVWPSSRRSVDAAVLRHLSKKQAASFAVIGKKIEYVESHARKNAEEAVEAASLPVVNRRVDPALLCVLDLFVRDFFSSWYGKLVDDPAPVERLLRNDLHTLVRNLRIRLQKIDKVKFFANDLMLKITQHFEKIRIAQTLYLEAKDKSKPAKIVVSSYLASEEREIAFLRKACEALLIVLLPESYAGYGLPRKILRDVITTTIVYPLINQICDPDYLNQKIISYISHHKDSLELHRTTFRYAASYEDFVKMIQECSSEEELRQLRRGIMTEIAQATTINDLKASKSSNANPNAELESGAGRAELVHVRNLARYLNQLMVAKNQCEHRLLVLSQQASGAVRAAEIPDRLPAKVKDDGSVSDNGSVDEAPAAGDCLEATGSDSETKSNQDFPIDGDGLGGDFSRSKILALESEIRDLEGLRSRVDCPRTAADLDGKVKDLTSKLRQLESFVLRSALWTEHIGQWRACVQSADCPPQSTGEPRNESGAAPDDPVFVLLVQKEQVMLSPDNGGSKFEFSGLGASPSAASANSEMAGEGWVVARKLSEMHELRNRLMIIAEEELKNKHLPAVNFGTARQKSPVQPAGRAWTETELHDAKAQVQTFLNAVLRSERLSHSQDVFVFLTPFTDHLSQDTPLKRKLDSEAAHAEEEAAAYPTRRTSSFSVPGKMKSKFSFATLFNRPGSDKEENSSPSVGSGASVLGTSTPPAAAGERAESAQPEVEFGEPRSGDSTNDSLNDGKGPENGQKGQGAEQSRDSIAEPLYGLVQELFEVQGIFRWLRKTLITFVQITYGRTINRQIRETVAWLVSDSMLVAYCDAVKDAYWPNGKLAPPSPPRSDEQKLRTRYEAKEKFLVSVPAVLSNLVGQQNGRRGAVRIFETVQDQRLNKQLVYSVLELLLMEVCPELNDA